MYHSSGPHHTVRIILQQSKSSLLCMRVGSRAAHANKQCACARNKSLAPNSNQNAQDRISAPTAPPSLCHKNEQFEAKLQLKASAFYSRLE